MKMKKLISFLCAAALTVSSFAGLAVTASAETPKSVTVAVDAGDTTANVTTTESSAVTGVLLLAKYSNNALTSLKVSTSFTTPANDVALGAAYADGDKLMAWEDLASMKPITVTRVAKPVPPTVLNTVAQVTITGGTTAGSTLTAAVTAKTGETFEDTDEFTYAWTKDGEAVDGGTDGTLADVEAGVYAVTATYTGDGNYTGTLTADNYTVTAADDTRTNLYGATVTVTPAGTVYTNTELTAAVAIPGATESDAATTVPAADLDYAWSKKGDSDAWTPVADATAATFTPTEAGTYKVTVTAKEASENYVGTKDSAEITVIVPADYVTSTDGKIKAISVMGKSGATGTGDSAVAGTDVSDKTYKELKIAAATSSEIFSGTNSTGGKTKYEEGVILASLGGDSPIALLEVDVADVYAQASTHKITLNMTSTPTVGVNAAISIAKLTAAPSKAIGELTSTDVAALTKGTATELGQIRDGALKYNIETDVAALGADDAKTLYYLVTVANGRETKLTDFGLTTAAYHTAAVASGITGGTVTLNKTEKLVAGDKVTITIAETDGYEYTADSLSVKDASNTDVTATAVEGQVGKYEFTMPDSNVTVTAAFAELQGEPATVSVAYKTAADAEAVKTTALDGTYVAGQKKSKVVESVLGSLKRRFVVASSNDGYYNVYKYKSGLDSFTDSDVLAAGANTIDVIVETDGIDYLSYNTFDDDTVGAWGTASNNQVYGGIVSSSAWYNEKLNSWAPGNNSADKLTDGNQVVLFATHKEPQYVKSPILAGNASKTIYFDWAENDSSGGRYQYIAFFDEADHEIARVRMSHKNTKGLPDGFYYSVDGGTNYTKLTDTMDRAWHTFAIDFDMASDKLTLTFDGTKAADKVAFNSAATGATVSYFEVVSGYSVVSSVLDNLAVAPLEVTTPAAKTITWANTLTGFTVKKGGSAIDSGATLAANDVITIEATAADKKVKSVTTTPANAFTVENGVATYTVPATPVDVTITDVALEDKTPATQATTATIAAVGADTNLYGKKLADLTNNFAITGTGKAYTATGTLKYVTDYTDFSGNPAEQSGNYLPFVVNVDGYNTNSTIKIKGSANSEYTEYTYADCDDGVFVFILGGQSTSLSIKVDRDGSGNAYEETEYTLSWTKATTAGEADKLYFTPATQATTATITAVGANTDLYGKKLADLTDSFAITGTGKAYTAKGTLKYVTGYTDFSSNVAEQSGNYLPFAVNVDGYNENSTIKIKGNAEGSTETTYTYADYNDDKFFVFILGGQSTSLSIKVDRDGSGTDYEETEYTLSWTKAENAGEADKLYFTPAPTPLTGVAITGTAKLGETLTATTTPANATATYQWQRADAADGTYTNIDGATAATYMPVEADMNKYLKVVATAGTGYTGTATSEATAQVAEGLVPLSDGDVVEFTLQGEDVNSDGKLKIVTNSYDSNHQVYLYATSAKPFDVADASNTTINGNTYNKRYVKTGGMGTLDTANESNTTRVLKVKTVENGVLEVDFGHGGSAGAEARYLTITQDSDTNEVAVINQKIDNVTENSNYVKIDVEKGKDIYITSGNSSLSIFGIRFTADEDVTDTFETGYTAIQVESDADDAGISAVSFQKDGGEAIAATKKDNSGSGKKDYYWAKITETGTYNVNVTYAANFGDGGSTKTIEVNDLKGVKTGTLVSAATTSDKPDTAVVSGAATVNANSETTYSVQLKKGDSPSTYSAVTTTWMVYTDSEKTTEAEKSSIDANGKLTVGLDETAPKLYVVATVTDTDETEANRFATITTTPFEVTVNTTFVTQSFNFVRPDGTTELESGYVVAEEKGNNTFALTALAEIATGAKKYESEITNGEATLNLNPNKTYDLTVYTDNTKATEVAEFTDYAPTAAAATTAVKKTIPSGIPEEIPTGVSTISPANAITGETVTITPSAPASGKVITGVKVNGTIDAEEAANGTYTVAMPEGGITSITVLTATKSAATISTFEGEQFGKQQSDLNEGLTFTKVEGENTYKATGTLKYVSGWTEFDGLNEELQSGNYISFQVVVTDGTEDSTISVVGNAEGSTPINVTKASEDFVIHLGGQSTALIVKVDKDGSGTDYSEETYTITLEKAADASEAATKLYYAPEVVAPTTKWTERTGSADAATYSITAAKEGDDVVTTMTAKSGNDVKFKYNLGAELGENWHTTTTGKELVVSYDLYVDSDSFATSNNDWFIDLLTTNADVKGWSGADDSCLGRFAGYGTGYTRFVGGKASTAAGSTYVYQTSSFSNKAWATVTERVDLTNLDYFAGSYGSDGGTVLRQKGVSSLTTDDLYLTISFGGTINADSTIKVKNVSVEVVDAPTYAVTQGTVTGIDEATLSFSPASPKMGETVTVTPSAGVIDTITADGAINLTNNGTTATFVMPAKAVSVDATLSNKKAVTITNTKTTTINGTEYGPYYGGGVIKINDAENATVEPGQTVTITAAPYYGYKLQGLNITGASPEVTVNGETATFTMPDANIAVTPVWTDADNMKVLAFDNAASVNLTGTFKTDEGILRIDSVRGLTATYSNVNLTNLSKVTFIGNHSTRKNATLSLYKGTDATGTAAATVASLDNNENEYKPAESSAKFYKVTQNVAGTFTGTDSDSLTATLTGSGYLGNYWYIVLEYDTSTPEPTTYTITAANNIEHGSITDITTSPAAAGTSVSFKVSPAEGYQLKDGTVKAAYNDGTTDVDLTVANGGLAYNSDNTTYTFSMPAGDVTVSAEFEAIYAVTFEAPTNGTLAVAKGETALTSGDTVATGSVITITATPADFYKINTLTIGGTTYTKAADASNPGATEYVVAADGTVTATATVTAATAVAATFTDNVVLAYDYDTTGDGTEFNENNRVGSRTVVNDPTAAAEAESPNQVLKLLADDNAGNDVGYARLKFADKVANAKAVKMEYDSYVPSNAGAKRTSISVFDGNIRTADVKSKGSYPDTGVIFNQCSLGSDSYKVYKDGEYDVYDQWLHTEITVDYTTRKMNYKVTKANGDVVEEGTAVDYVKTDASYINGLEFYTSWSSNIAYFDNIKVYTATDETKPVVINYIDSEGTVLKTARTTNAALGTITKAYPSDKAAFDYTDGETSTKYYCTYSGTTDSVTVTGNAETDKIDLVFTTTPYVTVPVKHVYQDDENGTIEVGEHKYIAFGTDGSTTDVSGRTYTIEDSYKTAIDDKATTNAFYVFNSLLTSTYAAETPLYVLYDRNVYKTTTFSITIPDGLTTEAALNVPVKITGAPTAAGAAAVDTTVTVTVAQNATTGTGTIDLLDSTAGYSYVIDDVAQKYLGTSGTAVAAGSTVVKTLAANSKTPATITVKYVDATNTETVIKTETIDQGVYVGEAYTAADTYKADFTKKVGEATVPYKKYTYHAEGSDSLTITPESTSATITLKYDTNGREYYYDEDYESYEENATGDWTGLTNTIKTDTATNSKRSSVQATSGTNVTVLTSAFGGAATNTANMTMSFNLKLGKSTVAKNTEIVIGASDFVRKSSNWVNGETGMVLYLQSPSVAGTTLFQVWPASGAYVNLNDNTLYSFEVTEEADGVLVTIKDSSGAYAPILDSTGAAGTYDSKTEFNAVKFASESFTTMSTKGISKIMFQPQKTGRSFSIDDIEIYVPETN